MCAESWNFEWDCTNDILHFIFRVVFFLWNLEFQRIIYIGILKLGMPRGKTEHGKYRTRTHEDPYNYFWKKLEYGINIFQKTWNGILVILDQHISKHFEPLKLWNFEKSRIWGLWGSGRPSLLEMLWKE